MRLAVWLGLTLCACAVAQGRDPLMDFSPVNPPLTETRRIKSPVLVWVIHPNPKEICAEKAQTDGQAQWQTACVYWSVDQSKCTFVTPAETTHSVLGRLFLLCLAAEGGGIVKILQAMALVCGLLLVGTAQAQFGDGPSSAQETPLVLRFTPPLVDRQRFTASATELRIIQEPRIKYQVRADGYEFCSRITGVPIKSNSRPFACAYWNVKRSECTVVTPEQTAYNYIGHELRHCFDGAFHD